MAVVKLKYIRQRTQLKRHVRYITHRRGNEEGRVTRALFTSEGFTNKRTVYDLIDGAARGTVFYKLMINLDPRREDIRKDLDLEHITRQTILALERQLGLTLPFAAVVHPADHTPLRHVHGIFLLPRRVSKEAFRELRFLAWTTATANARLQRRARDKVLGNPRYRSLSLYRIQNHYQKPQAALGRPSGRQIGNLKQWGRGHKLPRLQSGCSRCGFGLLTGISGFLPVCPQCGRGLGRQSQSLGLSL
jgi:hypothetical protein